jgi:hypothetical protein
VTPTEALGELVATLVRQMEQITTARAIHAPRCGRCSGQPLADCDGQADWRDESSRHDPQPECPVCVLSWGDEETEPWPCPTARALGVPDPTNPGDPS